MHIESLGSQGVTQRLRLLTPGIIEFFMIQQRNDRLVAEGGQIVNLEQLMAQHGIVAHALQHGGHQLIDKRAGGRKAVNANPRPGLLIENNMVQIVAIVPQTELGAHPVVADRRTKHFRTGAAKGAIMVCKRTTFSASCASYCSVGRCSGVMMHPE